MESIKTTNSFRCLSNFGLLTSIFNSQLHTSFKLIACTLFLCLAFHLCPSTVLAQGVGLYKDGKKILDLGEMIDSSLQAVPSDPFRIEPARMKLLKEVFGEKIPSQITPQREYVRLVLECRDIVQRIVSSHQTDSAFRHEIDRLLALEDKLSRANEMLLQRFSQIEKSLKENGYPEEKIDRHIQMVENHTLAADHLLELLANLRIGHESGDKAATENVIRELEQYFIDNIFRQDPPLLSSQPLPVMMQVKQAPVIEDQLPQAIPYPTIIKGERGPQPGDLDPTIDVQFTDEIIDLAASRNNSPVEMYNYVRDNFEFEAYLGSRKGSQQTLSHRRGNDYDQASLLIALLRVSGIPARYARAKVKMPIEQATNWLGIQDKKNAGSILTTCGMEGIIYIVNDDTVAIGCRRVWVEAWLPFINYRGAINDSVGYMWVPMDPTFKQYQYTPGINLPGEIGFDAEAFVWDYISTLHSETPIEMFKQMLLDSLSIYHPEATYDDLITTRSVIKETDGILPGTLPYELMEQDTVFSEIPSDKRYYIRFHVYGSGTDLDYTTSLPEIVEKQVTISFVGATPADQEIIDTAGGIFNVDVPYLVDLKPVLKIDGCEVARGSGQVMMGITINSDMHFTAPVGDFNEIPVVYNTIIAGNYQGIGIDTEDAFPAFFDLPETSCDEEYLGQEVHQTALTYLNNVDVGGDEAADLMHQVVMNDVSEAIVENTVTVLFSGPSPISFEWTGMSVDADRKIIGPFSVDGVDNDCDYMRLAGADGSIQENRVFETRFGEEAISAIKILELASDSGITICEITSSIAADCPGIDQPASVISAINSALAQGHHVIIPERGFTYYEWTGTGWIDIDPVTCAAGYIISGGKSGGETVQEWEITYPDLLCIEPEGPMIITPDSPNDLYCAESDEHWIFRVPSIKYWGIDEDGNCQWLNWVGMMFTVNYSIKEIAERWGPGDYIFMCGSNITDCGCTMIDTTVTIVKIEFPSDEFCVCQDDDGSMTVTIAPSGAAVSFESADIDIATVDDEALPDLAIHGVSSGQTSIQAMLNEEVCNEKDVTVIVVDLDVDSDRSGDVDGTQEEDDAEMTTPAIIIANNDDDDSDDDSDHSDNIVNETADVNDLTKLVIRKVGAPSLPEGWKAFLSMSHTDAEKVRVFDERTTSGTAVIGPGIADEYEIPDITTADLTYGIEAVDYPQQVDEQVTVALIIRKADDTEFASDEIKLIVAPFILMPNTRLAEKIYVSDCDNTFVTGLKNAVGSGKVVEVSCDTYSHDVWVQDEVEIGYVRVPVTTDTRVAWDLPRGNSGLDDWPEDELRGPDFGHFEEGTSGGLAAEFGGNLEVSPPVTVSGTEYKHGRVVVGTNMYSSLTDFLEAQNVQTPLIRLSVSWLAVGHVDEIMSFVPSGGGFKLLMADTEAAKDLLESFVKEDAGTATSGGSNTLTDGTKSWTTDEWSNGFIEITSGTGNGQVRQIASNTATQITVTRNWTTNPDNTSEYELVTEKSYRALFVEGDEEIGVATGATNNKLTDATKSWADDEWKDGGIRIIAGTGKDDQVRWITGNTATEITVDPDWDVQPDATSRYLVGKNPKGAAWVWESGEWVQEPALNAVKTILDNTDFCTFNDGIQTTLDANCNTLKAALGLAEGDVIKIPALFIEGDYGADAYVPGMVNMLVDGSKVVVAKPFGPKDGANDVFERDVETKLEGIGLTIEFLDDWDTYHIKMGEIHCGTNAKRTPPAAVKWWE